MIYGDMEILGIAWNKCSNAFRVAVKYPLSDNPCLLALDFKWDKTESEDEFLSRIIYSFKFYKEMSEKIALNNLILYDGIILPSPDRKRYFGNFRIKELGNKRKTYINLNTTDDDTIINNKITKIKSSLQRETIKEKRQKFLNSFKINKLGG